MKKLYAQRGFSTFEAIIVVAVLAIISFIGWTLINRQNSDQNTSQGTMLFGDEDSKEYVDSAEIYSVQVPKSWTIVEADDCCEEPPKDYSEISRSVTITPANVTEFGRGIDIQADKTGSLETLIKQNWADNNHTPEELTINGRASYYVKVEFVGDAESYTDYRYLIIDEKNSVYITFREFLDHPITNTNWNNEQFLDEFDKITKSTIIF